MHRDLVERRRWISEAEYKEGLTLAQLMPGPLAAELAIYLGYVHYGVSGHARWRRLRSAVVSDGAGPWLGVCTLRRLSWMQAVFYGVGAAVIGIIAIGGYKLTRKTIGNSMAAVGDLSDHAAVTIWTETEYIAMFLGAGYFTGSSNAHRGFTRGRLHRHLLSRLCATLSGLPTRR